MHSYRDKPRFDIPDKKKDEKWHEQMVYYIAGNGLDDNFVTNNNAMDINYRYYNGDTMSEEYEFAMETEDGEVYPAVWNNLNRIKGRIDVVLGEASRKGYEIKVEGINEEVKAKKLEYKSQLQTDMSLAPYAEAIEQESGVPLRPPYPVPRDPMELDQMVKNYKELSEHVMEGALKYVAKKNKHDLLKEMITRDVSIAGRGIIRTAIRNGIPYNKRVDPRFFVHDPHATDDDLSDAGYFGEVEYMRVSQAAELFDLSEEEITQAYEDTLDILHGQTTRAALGSGTSFEALVADSPVKFFDDGGRDLRVMVLRAVWRDVKRLKFKKSKDKHDNIHIKQLRPSDRDKDAFTKNIEIWRKGTLVAGKFLKEWGELENRPTDINTLSETLPPYTVVFPNYINYSTVSKVDQLRALQDFKNLVWYNIQKEFARAGGKGFIYDKAQLPEGWTVETMLKYLRTAGVGFIDSMRTGMPSQFNQFGQIDMTMTQAVNQFLLVNQQIDMEMDAISSINPARQGMMEGASQAVGVTRAALYQSGLSTETLLKAVDRLFTNVNNLNARLIKLTWDNPERYSPIIGDVGVDFIKQDIGLDLNDYAVFVEQTPIILDDEQMYLQLIQAAIQAGTMDYATAMEMMMEKDPREGLLKLRRMIADQEMKMAEAQQAQMAAAQQAQEAEMAQRQREAQLKQGIQDSVNKTDILTTQMDNERQQNVKLMDSKTKLRSKGIDAMLKKSETNQSKEEK